MKRYFQPRRLDADDQETSDRPSKTRQKQAMHELQELGEALVDMPVDTWKRVLPKLGLDDALIDAILDARRMQKHEARRRQLQYVGKLMRDCDPAPIREVLDAIAGNSAAETARMHRLERLRTQLLENEADTLNHIAATYPDADLGEIFGQLRQLRRNALKEQEQNKPPKSFRQIFQVLRTLEGQGSESDEGGDDSGDSDGDGGEEHASPETR